MDINNLTDHQAQLLIEMQLVFEPEDWVKLDTLYISNLSPFRKTFQMETLLLQARNTYIRKHGKQPDQGYDEDLENSIIF